MVETLQALEMSWMMVENTEMLPVMMKMMEMPQMMLRPKILSHEACNERTLSFNTILSFSEFIPIAIFNP